MTSVCVFWMTSLTWLFLLLLMPTVIFIYTQKCHEKSVLQNFNVKKFVVACLYIQINGTTTARKNTASNTKGIMNQHVAGALVEAIVLIVAEPWEWLAGEIFSLKFTKYRLAAGRGREGRGKGKGWGNLLQGVRGIDAPVSVYRSSHSQERLSIITKYKKVKSCIKLPIPHISRKFY